MSKKNNKESKYQLKPMFEGLQIGLTGVYVNNETITEEQAFLLMRVHSPKKIFDKYPETAEKDFAKWKKSEEEAVKNAEAKAEAEAEAKAEAPKSAKEGEPWENQ